MVITRTPYRISLVGGGTDHPEYYEEHGGAVIGFALKQYCHLMVRKLPPYFEYKSRAMWSRIELVNDNRDIEHPAINAVIRYEGYADDGLVIVHDGDLPARSGMGSSSSFIVGLMHALRALGGLPRIDKQQLANDAIYLERNLMHENVGCQDQIFAALGGFQRINFDGRGWRNTPVHLSPRRVEYFLSHLMLVFTSLTRHASELEGNKIQRLKQNLQHLHELRELVPQVEQALISGALPDINFIGHALHRGWTLKQSLAHGVSDNRLDKIYEKALRNGALGGKLLGAGGGGYFLFVVPPSERAKLKVALGNLIEVPIEIDYHGSRVMVFEPNGTR